jgi:hypothetical protein
LSLHGARFALFLVIIAATDLATRSAAAINIWLSPVGSANGTVTLSNQHDVVLPTATNREIHIWVRPDVGETLANVSLNLKSTNPGVIEFVDLELHNPLLATQPPPLPATPIHRFEFSVSQTTIEPDFIQRFGGFSVTNQQRIGAGMGPSTVSLDPLYDDTGDAFLLATATYDVLGLGTTDLYLQIGSLGMNQVSQGNADAHVVFGGGGGLGKGFSPDRALNAATERGDVNSAPLSATRDGSVTVVSSLSFPWRNPNEPADVNNDKFVTPVDVLTMINEINNPTVSNPVTKALPVPPVQPRVPPPYYDVSGDNILSAGDVVAVINHFNAIGQAPLSAGALRSLETPLRIAGVPEPSSLGLLVLAITSLLVLRGRTR